ncbi:tRNA uridine-5-carboxymethylaminomethyl(34) synthesis GTPase MnmE [Coxiella-like endosymbiont of Amblyomma americanum]|uniref:tRNA uridine-5-carboxymethylaminomethyl(34) synthesis GTPase MnmE n=1 Tax=Coxiella-like endosymbiont of Amblyomma americanum TaxID=1987500 RepID=UPI000F89D729|nr:tRNA uridine-5-carboxymethylaminomethyl(34) synthesis GTPase MnmE [Coxiella-like endosymbiont of Amblyomma americanum]AUJ58516.1 tRNA uridine-5-carboxymethylaminomethyl(34) synthesis GTPase MnmE [Coxiella-like endosymbiont of Amblyomma americanum]
MIALHNETIVALATPVGRGGIGIIRVSGLHTPLIAKKVIGFIPKPRYATLSTFKDCNGSIIDEGIALYFPKPRSFTGEDVLELHGHGGSVVMDQLLKNIIKSGARLAHPGEFSERAFLNKKIDLVQAEAIADLINATSKQAARSAMRSLQGEFSSKIRTVVNDLIEMRMHVETAIDFPEEKIDFLTNSILKENLEKLLKKIQEIHKIVQQGVLLQEGITVMIAGKPNVGKSSLLNLLSGREIAIVTNIPGTTRDILHAFIHIDGMPIHLLDTAGLQITKNIVEKEGIRRTKKAVEQVDLILLMVDITQVTKGSIRDIMTELFSKEKSHIPITIVENKIDLIGKQPSKEKSDYTRIKLSVKTNSGIEILKEHLKEIAGFETTNENSLIARNRHCDSIRKSIVYLKNAYEQLTRKNVELIAEELLQAQKTLAEITGEFSSDDLLRKIFSEFCIGK